MVASTTPLSGFASKCGAMGGGGMCSNVQGVGDRGIGNGTSWGVSVAGGFGIGSSDEMGNWSGPNDCANFNPEFNSQKWKFFGSWYLTGVTRDSNGNPLGNCDVDLLRNDNNTQIGDTQSDGSGNFTFTLGPTNTTMYIVAYLPGTPDVAGTSVNTLMPTGQNPG